MFTNTTNWSASRPDLIPAAQLLASLYPGLDRIRITIADKRMNLFRVSIKVHPSSHGVRLRAHVRARHLDNLVAAVIARVQSQPELHKIATLS